MGREIPDAAAILGAGVTATGPGETTRQRPGTETGAGDEVQTYVPFKAWLDAEPQRYIHLSAVTLLLLQALVRGYVKLGGWFVADDMSFIGRAQHLPFLSHAYLLQAWNGHFMPGSFMVVRGLNALWPVNYTPVAVVDLTLQLVAGVLTYRLLIALFGARPAILVPLAIFLFSPITLPAFLWWAAALNQLPGQVAMIGALFLQVRYHRLGNTRDGIFGAMSVAAGLMFSEKLLLVVPCVLGMTLLFFTPGPPLARLRHAVADHWRVWLGYAVVVVPYCVYYLTQVPSPVSKAPNGTIAVQTVGTALTKAVIPALFGGPLQWQQIGVGGVADPAPLLAVLALIASVLVVWVSVVRRRRAVFAWAMVMGYWLANAVLLGITRASYVGPIIGAEYRYSTDVCLIFAVFGTAAFLPIAGTFRRGVPQRLLPRPRFAWRPPWGTSSPVGSSSAGLSAEASAAGALALALIVPSLVSTFQYDAFWRDNGAAPYFANARADIASSRRHLTLVEMALPQRVQAGFLGAFIKTSTVMSGFEPQPRFLTPGDSADELFVPDDTGHLRAVFVDGFRNASGPAGPCGWRVEQDPVSIPLTKATLPWLWTVRIGYLATQDAATTVTAGTITTRVAVRKGYNAVYVLGEGAIGEVRLGGLSQGALCTADVTVGFPRATPDTRP